MRDGEQLNIQVETLLQTGDQLSVLSDTAYFIMERWR